VSRAQLVAAGVGRSSVHRALQAGAMHRIHRGVYSVVAPELLTEEGHLVAALLAAGEGALLSHGTAAWRWCLIPAPPSVIELAVREARTAQPGLTLHRSGRLRADDITRNGRFPTTTVPRTLLRALAEAEFHHDLRPADVERTLRRGHPGSASLRAALDAHVPGRGETKSQLERRFRRLLVRRGIKLPLRNAPVGPWTVDCLWPDRRLVVELDGGQHDRPHQADVDRDRDLWLRAHGYVVLRYGHRQLAEQPDAVVADLLAALG
jgi:very-short-patch-repair endonuclease